VHFGDWQCSSCGYWNNKFNKYCRGKGKRDRSFPTGQDCCGRKRTDDDMVQEDDGMAKFRVGSYFVGDWFCGRCAYWNVKKWHGVERARAWLRMLRRMRCLMSAGECMQMAVCRA
jgi:hypothetical protein